MPAAAGWKDAAWAPLRACSSTASAVVSSAWSRSTSALGRGAGLADLERFLLHVEPVGEQLSGKSGALVEGREA